MSIEPNAVMVMTCGDGRDRLDLAQHVQAVEVGHLDVGDDQVDAALLDALDAGAAAAPPPRPCSRPPPAPRAASSRIAASSSTIRIVARARRWPRAARASGSEIVGAASAMLVRDESSSILAHRLRFGKRRSRAPAGAAHPRERAVAQGRNTRNTAPPAAGRSTSIQPSWSLTMPWLTARPRPVPCPGVLGREERLEDLVAVGGGDAAAGVGDRQHRRTRRAAPGRGRPCAA